MFSRFRGQIVEFEKEKLIIGLLCIALADLLEPSTLDIQQMALCAIPLILGLYCLKKSIIKL